MSGMSSFYGGRQGASFVIVKKFDGIDIQSNSVYRIGWFAKDEDGYFYVPLIERTVSNYANYPAWGSIPRDGVTTVTSQSGVESTPLVIEYAEGMKQCFEQGGITASEVGYGEYVIIDTMSGLGQQTNPDNGKVYRRGMNYDDDLGGAEYIGQIVGPKGDSPKLEMTTITNILDQTEAQVRDYTAAGGDLVPGKSGSVYNDDITYGWATVRDDAGNVTGALIGFKFPYLIPEFTGIQRSPYYTQEDYDKGRISDVSLIGTPIKERDNFVLFIDNGFNTSDRDPEHGDTGHPYYRRWKFDIPHGIKGDCQTQLEIVPTKMRDGASLWGSADLSGDPVAAADSNTYVIVSDAKFNEDCVYPYDDSSAIVVCYKEAVPGVYYYGKIEDTYMLKIRYRQTWYDNHSNGDYEMIDLGDYNTIRKVWLADDGYLWVRYNADEDGKINVNEPIQWYDDVDLDNEGNLVFTYNTLKADGITHNTKEFEKTIDWVESVALANKPNPTIFDPESTDVNSGHFRIIFNNDSVENKTGVWTDNDDRKHAVWETDITWPQSVSLSQEGLLKFMYNNNLYYDSTIYTNPTEGSYSYSIPWITNVLIQRNGTFTITYNNNVNKNSYPSSEWNDTTHTWTTVLDFIDHVTIDDDGRIHFWYSNGNEASSSGYDNIRIKYLTNAEVNTGLIEGSIYDFEGEGSGDQKIHLTWNTEATAGVKDTSVIGAPLNYIMETIVTTYDEDCPNTPANHLLVLYSDPVYRNFLVEKYTTTDKKTNKIWSYTSKKFTEENTSNPYSKVTPSGIENPKEEGWYELINSNYVLTTDTSVIVGKTYYEHNIKYVIRNDWFDLGYVKGEAGGLHIIGSFTLAAGETYSDYLKPNIPPEAMTHNPEDRGWAYAIIDQDGNKKIYTYDYINNQWFEIADLNASAIDPTQIIIMDNYIINSITGNVEPATDSYKNLPKDKGLWLVENKIKSVY